VLEHQPPAANQLDPAVPAALAEIAARAMEKDPEHRYRSARSLSRELRHWLDENAAAGDPLASEPEAPRRSRLLVWGGAALAAAAFVGIGLWVGLASHREAEPVAAAATTNTETPAVATSPAPAPADTPVASAAPVAAVVPPAELPAPAAGVAAAPPAPVVTRPAAPPSPAVAPARTAAAAAKDTARDRRARDTRAAPAPAAAGGGVGTVRVAITPWGNVEVDGAAVGTAPPLNELTLPEGAHQITVRNADFPPYTTTINVVPGQPVTLRHRFGS
jgi:serine/threonine-protein kinase